MSLIVTRDVNKLVLEDQSMAFLSIPTEGTIDDVPKNTSNLRTRLMCWIID
jgi:hypothetical protein